MVSLALATVLSCFPLAAQSAPAVELRREALGAFDDGRDGDAFKAYSQLLKDFPDDHRSARWRLLRLRLVRRLAVFDRWAVEAQALANELERQRSPERQTRTQGKDARGEEARAVSQGAAAELEYAALELLSIGPHGWDQARVTIDIYLQVTGGSGAQQSELLRFGLAMLQWSDGDMSNARQTLASISPSTTRLKTLVSRCLLELEREVASAPSDHKRCHPNHVRGLAAAASRRLHAPDVAATERDELSHSTTR